MKKLSCSVNLSEITIQSDFIVSNPSTFDYYEINHSFCFIIIHRRTAYFTLMSSSFGK